MSDDANTTPQDENELIALRRAKLEHLREQGNAYPNDFRRKDLAADLTAAHGDKTKEELAETEILTSVSGRVMLRRAMGKASFVTLQDVSGRVAAGGHANHGPRAWRDRKRCCLGL